MTRTLADAREAIAAAVTDAGLPCLPYPPDAVAAPTAWIDGTRTDFTGVGPAGGYFCLPGLTTMRVMSVAARHDRPAAIAYLEQLIPQITEALTGIPGLRLISHDTGVIPVAGKELPAVLYTVEFHS